MTTTKQKIAIVVSDLFKGEYDHEKRLGEQEILYERLIKHKDDPNLLSIAEMLKDMTTNKIASIVNFEMIVEKLKRYETAKGRVEIL